MRSQQVFTLAAAAPALVQAEANIARTLTSTYTAITTITSTVFNTAEPSEPPVPWSNTSLSYETTRLTSTTTSTVTTVITPPQITNTLPSTCSSFSFSPSTHTTMPVITITIIPTAHLELTDTTKNISCTDSPHLGTHGTGRISSIYGPPPGVGTNFSASAYPEGWRAPVRSSLSGSLRGPHNPLLSNTYYPTGSSGYAGAGDHHATGNATGSTITAGTFETSAAGRLRPNWALRRFIDLFAAISMEHGYGASVSSRQAQSGDPEVISSPADAPFSFEPTTTSTINVVAAKGSTLLGVPLSDLSSIEVPPAQSGTQPSFNTKTESWSNTLNTTAAAASTASSPAGAAIFTSTSIAVATTTEAVDITSMIIVNSTSVVLSTSVTDMTETVAVSQSPQSHGPSLTAGASATGAASSLREGVRVWGLPSFLAVVCIFAMACIGPTA